MPLRLEVRPRDVAAEQAVLVRRDSREKWSVPLATLAATIETSLAEIQADLLRAAKQMLDEHTDHVESIDELAARVVANAGWSLAHWCGDAGCEAQVKRQSKATIRCIPRDQPIEPGRCIVCGGSSSRRVIFARAY